MDDEDYLAPEHKEAAVELLTGKRRTRAKPSKANAVIDDETRRLVRAVRLASLEDNNYVEETNAADAAYIDQEEEEKVEVAGGSKKKKGHKKAKNKKLLESKKLATVKSFDQIIEEEIRYLPAPNYLTVAAGPSSRPPRHFCSVCGFRADYTCPRCGCRFCSLRCHSQHKETRCLKFAS